MCSCRSGFQLASDGMGCEGMWNIFFIRKREEGCVLRSTFVPSTDINECNNNNGGCAQTCTNSDGSFQCSCNSGFRLSSDGRTCNG